MEVQCGQTIVVFDGVLKSRSRVAWAKDEATAQSERTS